MHSGPLHLLDHALITNSNHANRRVDEVHEKRVYGSSYFTYKRMINFNYHPSHVLGSCGTSDNLDQFASNDSLSGSVEKNLETGNHVSGVLGGVLQGRVSVVHNSQI
jgi:hypothetical protein